MVENNIVNHPKHYKESSLECIDTMIICFGAMEMKVYCCINAYKYIFRYKSKNGIEDLEKASWYLNKCQEICKEYELELPEHYEELRNELNKHIVKWRKENE